MPNSLTLKQCHFDGQGSILFPKYIFEFSQGLYNPDRILFFYCIPLLPPHSKFRSSFDYHFLTRFQWARARPRATPTNPHVKYKCVPVLILQYLCFPSEQCLNTKKKRLVSDLQDLKRSARST